MFSGNLDLEGLFLVNGNAERVDWLRQRYDSGEEVELEKDADLASAVSLLRLFLQELPEPVIPTAIQGHILQLHQGVYRGTASAHVTLYVFITHSVPLHDLCTHSNQQIKVAHAILLLQIASATHPVFALCQRRGGYEGIKTRTTFHSGLFSQLTLH